MGIEHEIFKKEKKKTPELLGIDQNFLSSHHSLYFFFFTIPNLSSTKIQKLELIMFNTQCYFTDFFFLKKQTNKNFGSLW